MLLNLKSLNESLAKQSLTEALNPTFPSWLKQGLLHDREQFGTYDRQKRDYKGRNEDRDWRSFGKTRADKRQEWESTSQELTLWYNAVEQGFLEPGITVYEAPVPTKATDPHLKDPYIPIFGLYDGQIYIPGFNDREELIPAYTQRSNPTLGTYGKPIPDDYYDMVNKMSKRVFGTMAVKNILVMTEHFAFFRQDDLKKAKEARDKKVGEREKRIESERVFYREHPEYQNDKFASTGQMAHPWEYNAAKNNPGEEISSWGNKYTKRMDKSGYLVSLERFDDKLKALRAEKLSKRLEELHDTIVECWDVYKGAFATIDLKDQKVSSTIYSALNDIRSNISQVAKFYNETARKVELITSDDTSTEEAKQRGLSNLADSMLNDSDYTMKFKEMKQALKQIYQYTSRETYELLDPEEVDWLE